ncbi:MAG: YqgE/AlgH family protein [Saprospiraceae bacterium]|nr:YqgE/AlgH family protein [Saprospiraceae bacterium]
MSAKEIIATGHLLLAKPFMEDPYFKRSVVLLCEHNENGSLGFILNKPIDMNINDIMSEFPAFDAEVFYGGPVQTDTLHYIHNVGNLLEDSVKVAGGVYWGGDFENLKFLIESKLISPANVRFFVGYAGWEPGQIEEELAMDSWLAAEMDANYLFKMPSNHLWSQVMHKQGNAYEVLADIPEHLSWN